MKKILLIVILLFAMSISVNAFDFSKLLFESAIETDRFQSYQWHMYSQIEFEYVTIGENDNIKLIGGEKTKKPLNITYEANPFIAGTSRKEFNNIVDNTKKLVNLIKNKKIYIAITLLEIYNVIQNNNYSRKIGLPQIWTISYSWQF